MLIKGFKASTMDWLTTRNLPSFTDEIEYITTKNANKSVMKSAYDTSQRSWFSCSSCFFFLAMRFPYNRHPERSEGSGFFASLRMTVSLGFGPLRLRQIAAELLLLELLHVNFKNLPDGLGLGAIDHQLKALLEKRIGHRLQLAFQREQPLFAAQCRQFDDLRDHRLGIHMNIEEDHLRVSNRLQ